MKSRGKERKTNTLYYDLLVKTYGKEFADEHFRQRNSFTSRPERSGYWRKRMSKPQPR